VIIHQYGQKLLKKTRHAVCKSVPRLAGECSIVRILNDFQPELILLENVQDVQFVGYVVSVFFRWQKWGKPLRKGAKMGQ